MIATIGKWALGILATLITAVVIAEATALTNHSTTLAAHDQRIKAVDKRVDEEGRWRVRVEDKIDRLLERGR